MIPNSSLLTIPEVASQLRLHPITIRRYIREGKLAAMRVGGRVRITSDTLAEFATTIDPTLRHKAPTASHTRHHHPFTLTDPLWRLKGIATPVA